ncbi:hypothetical protein DOM21_18735 [Bacteriovorax stolpii]|uniref:Uncharacterized protein n=1 Tax=Bacteriovorax stolpii TaxID=960 RepID=A0A2K9NNH4_BACTC|nr:hypothetical protein C0V70_00535 [Bacteriovorax stolpii]QDK43453.1 hypothetical protein DOM21_18735 [Bacteriovorax stolpii]TDP53863.1 hypothetical protein C8D79_1141 [Bacteriovorax stolpii]
MENTLANGSNIFKLKWKFFTFRIVSYFSFLLIPVYVQKGLELKPLALAFLMSLYILFIVSQWFLLGKEIDHRLKIYFRVNSSIDRVVYRLFLGMFFFILLFNLVSFLGSKWVYNSYWITWAVLGLFYSWPTRGKIIQESVSSNFGEFKFLDRFEKTLVALILLMFVFSVPELPPQANVDLLKLYFDPLEKIGNPFWNFMIVNYYPFKTYPGLFRLAWSLHFYIVGLGLFLLVFYAFLRFFVSRRLSLLGVFALVSSWSFSKTLTHNIEFSFLTTYSLIWIWTLLWVTKSSTYRAGLFLGLVSYWGALINQSYAVLVFFQIGLLYFFFLKDRTSWYKRQLLRYALFGIILTLLHLFSHSDLLQPLHSLDFSFITNAGREIDRKGFFVLGVFGIVIAVFRTYFKKPAIMKDFQMEKHSLNIVILSYLIFIGFSIVWDNSLVSGFGTMWALAFLSLLPLELIFQSIARLRSKRNMIYVVYILICLLDSHFEGRVKLFVKIFNS